MTHAAARATRRPVPEMSPVVPEMRITAVLAGEDDLP